MWNRRIRELEEEVAVLRQATASQIKHILYLINEINRVKSTLDE